ncbi:bifunctional hydroxymethylpyrimidine kinase/phosphomethylpyrimidine kinase [Aeromicrobium flavum]|uniref:Bifunctional hydroxymethylpyrimidine kinase/phosphomethylpyrimidine kinase n=1 Tax=Aeromicrobium flavum TaxID=416568 RepID=A0A512HYB3_9ACTN|nr:bifunctional hydroxymethylpyrimidine kinase/phosphomethylpyrimidine kinase [Aeromicrobium flavum]GEO90370.1 bifunctional hydroxymethylpyrimidine kinase/phosphomethylpyrimidine kinase [Aeromicrobium flavum]
MTPRVLSVAGTDPTGGAGIQADLKTIGALGGYAMAVVTALVAQNTRGVRSVHVPPVSFLTEQLEAVSDDVEIDAVKLGMLHSTPLIDAVATWLDRVRPPVVVLDPVMVATSGDRLLDEEAEAAIRRLCHHVDLVTPNLPELAVLTERAPATTWDDAVGQATDLATASGATVLLKGGHLAGAACDDAIVTADAIHSVPGRRVRSTSTHGTGCTLSSAMATLAASGTPWPEALHRAKAWLTEAIDHGAALRVGQGNGPVDHFHALRAQPSGTTGWSTWMWEESADVRARVEACDFVRRLGDGSLEPERFARYLAQDALYLGEYARWLVRAGSLATGADERLFWTRAAASALSEEERLHRHWVGEPAEPGPATRAYLDHLRATAHGGGHGELVAALLPCYWLYADLGARLVLGDHPAHPYTQWLRLYADPTFAAAARTARDLVDRAADAATPAERARMRSAFARSMVCELAFFEAAGPPPLSDARPAAAGSSSASPGRRVAGR